MITQSNIQTILSIIFVAPIDRVVPKQGNWYNPQDITNSGNWVAFIIRNARPRCKPYIQPGAIVNTVQQPPILTTSMIGKLELQIVGPDAETLAQSVSLWLGRDDVISLWDTYQAQLCADGLGEYNTSNFIQDGDNSVLAYNVNINIQWSNMIQLSQTQLTTASWTSAVTVGS